MALSRREALLLGGVAVAAATAGFVAGPLLMQRGSGGAEAEVIDAGRFTDLNGRARQLGEWRGKVLVLNFWATWCAPCREEIPMFIAARGEYASYGVEFVGIGIDQADKIAEFAKQMKIDYPLLVADASAMDMMRQLGNRAAGLPFTVIVDRAGLPVARKLGAVQRVELDRMLSAVLGREPPRKRGERPQ